MTRGGRFALLTNFREKDPGRVAGAPSRGALPLDFLRGGAGPLEYLRGLDLARHNGFNLVVGDLSEGGKTEVAYVTNRSSSRGSPPASAPAALSGAEAGAPPSSRFSSRKPVLLPPGVYGLSNGVLGDSWCKVDRGVAILKGMLERGDFDDDERGAAAAAAGGGGGGTATDPSASSAPCSSAPASSSHASSSCSLPWDALFRSLMGDTSRAPAHLVPETGVPRHIEERLTSTFVTPFELLPKGGGGGGATTWAAETTTGAAAETAAAELKKYGTRSQTALAVFVGGRAALRERRLVSWRERGGAAVAAGGEEEEERGEGAGAAAGPSSLPLPPQPFKIDGCPIQSEWREVAHEFTVRSFEEKKREGGEAAAESERELVVDEAGECATAFAEEVVAETELKTSP